jgi:hypothetical protein
MPDEPVDPKVSPCGLCGEKITEAGFFFHECYGKTFREMAESIADNFEKINSGGYRNKATVELSPGPIQDAIDRIAKELETPVKIEPDRSIVSPAMLPPEEL